ncbi:hypothetical protein QTP88_025893 [Uroleucon formosanum]
MQEAEELKYYMQVFNMLQLSPPRYSSMSPLATHDEEPSQSRGADEERGLREFLTGYDEMKGKSWLIYQDCNNLYGWEISEHLPYGGFNWVEPNLKLASRDFVSILAS